MRIFRESDEGGRFLSPLALNVKLTFTPVGQRGRSLELTQQVRFPADPRATWGVSHNKAASSRYVKVDTDGDGTPDAFLPGPSSFRAGARPQNKYLQQQTLRPTVDPDTGYSHISPTHVHTTTTTTTEPLAN